ncbi:MAG: hypothetical protein IJZ16_05020, partial [Clostridia bacterium]|nr:hypothetical protein [Clostridia bacterium]
LGLAPFLKKETLTRIINQNEKITVKQLIALAPFLEQKVLDEWAMRTDFIQNPGKLSALAPFVSKEVLIDLFHVLKKDLRINECCGLAPFLPKGTLNHIVLEHQGDLMEMCSLLPFVDKECLVVLAERCVKENNYRFLSMLAPFIR